MTEDQQVDEFQRRLREVVIENRKASKEWLEDVLSVIGERKNEKMKVSILRAKDNYEQSVVQIPPDLPEYARNKLLESLESGLKHTIASITKISS